MVVLLGITVLFEIFMPFIVWVLAPGFDATPGKLEMTTVISRIMFVYVIFICGAAFLSAGERVGYGTTVEIDHGLGFTTLYAHLSQILVSRGDWVRPGTVIGLAGSSGRSTGPHLHYEIRYKGAPFDPTKFIKEE